MILGEIKVIAELLELGYEIYTSIDGHGSIDILAMKDGKILKVEVKSSQQESHNKKGWQVEIKRVRHNKNRNRIINFDASSVDILAIYIKPEDRVILIPSKKVTQKSRITIPKRSTSQMD